MISKHYYHAPLYNYLIATLACSLFSVLAVLRQLLQLRETELGLRYYFYPNNKRVHDLQTLIFLIIYGYNISLSAFLSLHDELMHAGTVQSHPHDSSVCTEQNISIHEEMHFRFLLRGARQRR